MSDKVAGYWLQASLIVFLVFRFLMVGLMGRFDARKLLLFMCSLGVALSLFAMVSVNILGVLAIISLSACISLLFPTIYGEALMGLGEDTKYGAAGLVMAIIGGATMPLVQSASWTTRLLRCPTSRLPGASWWWPPTGSTHCARPGPSVRPDGKHSHHSLRPRRTEWAERMLSGSAWQG